MEKNALFFDLYLEYLNQFGETNVLMAMRNLVGVDFAIEMLQNRNGAKIIEVYTNTKADDYAPEYVYE
jgi:hypothetical protein